MADVAPEILAQLNAGAMEARTLAENLAVDFGKLLRAVAPELPSTLHDRMAEAVQNKLGVVQRGRLGGELLLAHFGPPALERFARHPSDTVRGWACYVVELMPELPLSRRLTLVHPLADDPHSGVREWAWMALRPHVAADIGAAIQLLGLWTKSSSPRIRRFASEVTRPRGVWCSHIGALKEDPSRGGTLLEPLRADPEKYVQDSVANWLNDASKSAPEWVREICARWRKESPCKETERICKRALRTIEKEEEEEEG
jgi:3-methyladenine DNA glycosylase AlkC